MPYDPADPIFSDSLFQMAKRQFEVIAEHLGIAEETANASSIEAGRFGRACPFIVTTGRSTFSTATAIQHHLAVGPTKGGTRFAPQLTIGESAALAVWMSWKCALAGLLTAEPRAECGLIRSIVPAGTRACLAPLLQ